VASLVGLLAKSGELSAWWSAAQGPVDVALGTLAVVAGALAFGHAVSCAARASGGVGGAPAGWALVWLVASMLGLLSVPAALVPQEQPQAWAVGMLVLLLAPASLSLESARWAARVGHAWPPVAWSLVLLLATLGVGQHLWRLLPFMESPDFYFFVAGARDMLDGVTNEAAYLYFPGIYAFWRTVLRALGVDLDAMHGVVLALVWVNMLLVGAVCHRMGLPPRLSILAGLLYALVGRFYEVERGLAEPVATLPLLVALALWAGQPLRGSRGWAWVAILGLAAGLTVYSKQQAGLLTVGLLGLLPARWRAPDGQRDAWAQLVAVPLVAAGTLCLGVLAEGHGLRPLMLGLGYPADYGTEGTLWTNTTRLMADAAGFWVGMAACALAAPWLVLRSAQPPTPSALRVERVMFTTALAAVGSLPQFVARANHHYVLLALPMLIIFAALVVHLALQRLDLHGAPHPLAAAGAAVVAASLLFTTGNQGRMTASLPLVPRTSLRLYLPLRAIPDYAADLEALKGQLPTDGDVLVCPPSRNDVHLVLGTRVSSSPIGYGFPANADHAASMLGNPRVKAAIMFQPRGLDGATPWDPGDWDRFGCLQALSRMEAYGFHLQVPRGRLALYRRN
jgi:hypothetical protein